jgi:hypothetical protein
MEACVDERSVAYGLPDRHGRHGFGEAMGDAYAVGMSSELPDGFAESFGFDVDPVPSDPSEKLGVVIPGNDDPGSVANDGVGYFHASRAIVSVIDDVSQNADGEIGRDGAMNCGGEIFRHAMDISDHAQSSSSSHQSVQARFHSVFSDGADGAFSLRRRFFVVPVDRA